MATGEKNAYWCEDCRGYVVTIDVDDGVTPMFLACRVKGEPTDPANDCRGTMRSMMYPAEPWPEADGYGTEIPTEPTWEWYRPQRPSAPARVVGGIARPARRRDNAEDEHVAAGGLLLRRKP